MYAGHQGGFMAPLINISPSRKSGVLIQYNVESSGVPIVTHGAADVRTLIKIHASNKGLIDSASTLMFPMGL